MAFMNVFCVLVAQLVAPLSGGIQISLLVLQRYFKLIDLLQIQEIQKQQKGFRASQIHSASTDAMEL
jgi:hypothetical protein